MSLRTSGPERRTPPSWRADRPPRWTARAALTVSLVVLAVVVAWGIVGQLHDLLIILLCSLFLGFAIEPAVNWFARRGWRRGAATGLIYLIGLLLALALIASVGALVVDQVAKLASSLPDLINSLSTFMRERFHVNLSDQLSKLSTNAGTIGATVAANALLDRADGARIGLRPADHRAVHLLPRRAGTASSAGPSARCSRPPASTRCSRCGSSRSPRPRATSTRRVLLGMISAIAHAVAFWIIGVPYAITLGLFVGVVGQFIPTVGTYIGAALPALVALTVSPRKALLVILFAVVYQQIESYL